MKRFLLFVSIILFSMSMLSASIFRPKFALVLSGGGAKGLAHIPILKELDRRGIVPDIVLGTSMGAVVGGFYAAGYSGEELERVVRSNDLMSYFLHLNATRDTESIQSPFTGYDTNLLTVEFGSSGIGASAGLIDDQYVNGFIRRHLSKVLSIKDFDKLSIPFRAIGADITNNRMVVFSSGSLFDAIRASMSLPVIFSPVQLEDGSYIMDGGLENNMPSDIARDLGADIVLAVDVNDATHIYGDNRNDMSTLSGAFSQFSDYLTEPNTANHYDDSDWVIVPETGNYSSLSFGAAEEILEAGQKAVDENMDVFDELEKRLKPWIDDMEKEPYGSILAPRIDRVIADETIPAAFIPALEEYEGKTMDYYTIRDFEDTLDSIRLHEGLQSVTYEIADGVIYVTATDFPSMSGSISLGLSGGIGLRWDGSSKNNSAIFVYTPKFTLSGDLSIADRLDLTYGVRINEGITIDVGLSYPFLSDAFLYGTLGIQYGQLSYLSIPGTRDYMFGNDLGLYFKGGLGYLPIRTLRLDFIFAVEYTYLSDARDGTEFRLRNAVYPYIAFSLVYDNYDGSDSRDNGFELQLTGQFGGDFPDDTISYAIEMEFYGCYGPTDIFKFIFEGGAATIRRPDVLSDNYVVTKLGQIASDWAYMLGGIRLPLPFSTYLDAGIFFEISGGDYDDIQRGRDLIPFAYLSSENIDVGGYIGAGISTSFGRIGAGFYISATPRISFIVGLV